ncbi:hypothetical protein QE152_g21838 [Popillia japonica]|uniref:Uncharacterized protein n=1 Tax=Popillia japonica TaxID=7064 RepID=A0AAW1KLX2_POPJA
MFLSNDNDDCASVMFNLHDSREGERRLGSGCTQLRTMGRDCLSVFLLNGATVRVWMYATTYYGKGLPLCLPPKRLSNNGTVKDRRITFVELPNL